MINKYLMALMCFILFASPSLALAETPKKADAPIEAGFVTKEEPSKMVVPYVANFIYTPTGQQPPSSAEVTFTVANVKYQSSMNIDWITLTQFSRLDQAFKDDLSEILKARGFSVLGPFASDKIPSADKKVIDLSLVATIGLTVGGPPVYRLNDLKVEIEGAITLELREIATRKLKWSKGFPFKLTTFGGPPPWDGKIQRIIWKDNVNARIVEDEKIAKYIASVELTPESMNDIAQALEKQYPGLMAAIFNAMDPQEMIAIKQQIHGLKGKKGN